jgi:hypothetical protein
MTYNVWDTCMLVPGFSRAECANWVQAIVSVGAVVVTGILFWIQLRATRRSLELAEKATVATEASVRVARESLEVSNRAYVSITGMENRVGRLSEAGGLEVLGQR